MSKSKETWWYCLRNSKSAFVTCLEIGRLFSLFFFGNVLFEFVWTVYQILLIKIVRRASSLRSLIFN